jgi:chromosome segregation ATPase
LDELGVCLAAEEERLDAERARLAEAWGKIHEVVETSRKVDEAVRLRCEEALREAKDIRVSTAAEVEEILAEGREKLAEVEAHEEALAARKETLIACEEAVAAREREAKSKLQELKQREEEAARHESSLEFQENELSTECSRLETMESQLVESQRVLAGDKASYDKHVKKANARLMEKEVREQNAKKLAEGLEKVREEFREKAKSQEERFTVKQKELKKELQDARRSRACLQLGK